jgi:HKD family nuclease
MKEYKIKVNGKEYLVEVEEVKEGTIAREKKNSEEKKTQASSGSVKVEAPMQGNVFV